MKTIEASPEVLRALVRGLDDLYDGDLKDRAQAEAVTVQVFEATGLMVTRSGVCAASEVTQGYVRLNVWAAKRYPTGEWVDELGHRVEDGTNLYLDPMCKVFIRTTENG